MTNISKSINMKKIMTLLLAVCSLSSANGQDTLQALFLGNSYTGYNSLTQITANLAASTGDYLITGSNTPGGHTLEGHSTNATSLGLIQGNDWDFVVLQEQSVRPSFPIEQVQSEVYPFAASLNQTIKASNPCTQTTFYMTWGREDGYAFGCANWPPVCTYEGMDSLLRLRYEEMADDNNALVSPVSVVWRYIRNNHPEVDLYVNDGSHPSLEGSYAAACTFYTIFFKKDPTLITFHSGLPDDIANTIKAATKVIVFNDLSAWNVGKYDATADFNYETDNLELTCTNGSSNANNYTWHFGDGTMSNEENPTHNYAEAGSYEIQLIASNCGIQDTSTQTVMMVTSDVTVLPSTRFRVYPTPCFSDFITLESDDLGIGKSSLTIVDILGRTVKTISLEKAAIQTIDVSDLGEGIYQLMLKNEQEKTVNSAPLLILK